ncbi:hypothetical protein [Streptomyces sp. NBC_00996]|uniref:hypothetical protein n=1 Tax=Streptomyces sp. NBC_00996 TaxID=2903710 RepID=UPI00386AD5D2|nr:hypothetical protein OG390_46950 [Streptomyces sp. NBC_00996]
MADADQLFARLAEDLAPRGAKLSKMFGMPCLKDPNGKAFVSLHEGALVVRLYRDTPEHAEALALAGAHLFDPMGGRPMKDWVCVPLAASAQWLPLTEAARAQPR